MKKHIWMMFLTAVVTCGFLQTGFCLTEQEMGQSAEAAGKWREALTHYTNAYQEAYKNNSSELSSLEQRIIALYLKLDPKPALPEEAKQHMARGEAAVEMATDEKGLEEAAAEFEQAILIVPWNAKVYYNMGVVREKQGQYERAIGNFKSYLLAAPDAPDAEAVRTQIIKLEYKLEKTRQHERQKEDVRESLTSDTWRVIELIVGREYLGGTFASLRLTGDQFTCNWRNSNSTGMELTGQLKESNLTGSASIITTGGTFPGSFTAEVSADGKSIVIHVTCLGRKMGDYKLVRE